MDVDDNPRPQKRIKLDNKSHCLPPEILLLSLPSLVAHPPTHKHHTRSLFLSQLALRKCLSVPGLDSSTECRAWTELAEVGLRIGLNEPGVEREVEMAITKALVITKKHPSLRAFKTQLTHLSSKLALRQNNSRFAQNTLKKHLTDSILPSDPPHVQYSAHLAYMSSLSTTPDTNDTGHHHSPSSGRLWVLTAIRDFHRLATNNGHQQVALLATVLELHEYIQAGLWSKVGQSLTSVEELLGITSHLKPAATPAAPSTSNPEQKPQPLGGTDLEKVLVTQTLMIGIIYHTYTGDNANAQSRTKKLHDMLDGGALEAFGKFGVVEVDLGGATPLLMQVTHPKVVFGLGFLVSSVAKRDPVGRKPKRRVFASEGVALLEREVRKEVPLPLWASVADVHEIQLRMQKMKADMLCELIGVAITRSEFDDAERLKLSLIHGHTASSLRTVLVSPSIKPILHTHSRKQIVRGSAIRLQPSYPVNELQLPSTANASNARHPPRLTPNANANEEEEDGCEDYWVNVSARAGAMWLRVGVASATEDDEEREDALEALRMPGMEIAKECEGLGGTLQTVGAVLTACLAKEFLVTKTHLRTALQLTSAAGDNHLRALILCLIAEQYLHTSMEHAETMLGTAEQIAAGLGAQPKPKPLKEAAGSKGKTPVPTAPAPTGVGNAHLRLWIGERSLELKRRAGDEEGTTKQAMMNDKLARETEKVETRSLKAR
ncbi:unnamed protein product [Cyclocybe aegerita]|uniref:Uncharacterized protein n=1 Tax=Cyclocybe aegerita TaxID=1973307 RepID=A0A8S0WSD4_CYCAE|nr:unnamed protein product [Cyclocybe aegerita]